ncbi:MAG: hypothetical protein U0570_14620 [Phycisphaerales bacterium]
MASSRLLLVALGLLASVHAVAVVWCITGGLDARASDMAAFRAVADPLRSKGEVSEVGMSTLERNVEKRSGVHATVMFTYAAVHAITAIALFAGVAALRRAAKPGA